VLPSRDSRQIVFHIVHFTWQSRARQSRAEDHTDGTKWSYKAKGRRGGIEKASVALVQGTTFEVQVKGKASDFRVDTCDLRLEIVLGGDAEATAGLCTTRTFGRGGSKPGDLQPGNSRQGHCAA
jgi:hypothetical protein